MPFPWTVVRADAALADGTVRASFVAESTSVAGPHHENVSL
jgi:hypothetical protein